MRLKVTIAALLLAAVPLSPAVALVSPSAMHLIAPVLANKDYAAKLDGVRFYFGAQEHPAVAKSFGKVHTLRRTNGLGKEPEEACQRAFASALILLAEDARKQGADAVINVHSGFAARDEASTTEYVCGTGAVFTGMSLSGEIVKLQ